MNKRIISLLLLTIMFLSPFAFAGNVGGLGTITGKFSYGGVDYIAKDSDTIVRTIDDVSREYTKQGELWGFIGAKSGDWIPISNPSLDPNWKNFQELANEAIVDLVVPDVATDTVVSNVPVVASSEITGVTKVGVEEGSKVLGVGSESGSMLSKLLGAGGGSVADAIFSGAQWAGIGFMAGQMIGPMVGFSEANTNALSTALSVGLGMHKMFAVGSKTAGTFLANPLVGVGVGSLVFLAMYRDEGVDVVEFKCMPWQAPSGGDKCELCNDADLPCSEYRCRSLGQNCEIVNSGTEDEKCVAISHDDVSPPVISPNEDMLSLEYEYDNVKNSPPGPGFEIVPIDKNKDCLEAFSPLTFGINVDEPAQCKIDFTHTEKFDDMMAYMGENNLYLYNHSEKFSLPSVAILEKSPLELENGKDLTFFIRCKDKSGNENSAEYAVRFCVDSTPDTTPPKVEASSIASGGCVAEGVEEAEVKFYTNEPAECRWSNYNQDYDSMQGEMTNGGLSQVNSLQLFGHIANLGGIARENIKFYIRCKDQPDAEDSSRNKMRESFEFSLRGSMGFKTKNSKPSGKIFGGISPMPVELYIETLLGCNNGQAVCSYSSTYDKNGKGYIMFFDTNSIDGVHTQRLDLTEGDYKYFIRCVDEGGNLIEDTIEFELDIDTDASVIARIYEEAEMLKIVTVRESECSYSLDNCDFSFEEGVVMPYENSIVHIIDWDNTKTFYIKCRDEFRDVGVGCSAIVRPMRNFL